MTKPHEETWEACLGEQVHVVNGRTMNIDVGNAARVKLIAQAPAMARLLLKLQWSGLAYGDGEPCCPACQADERDGKHSDVCELVATLRAAGVLP